MMHYSCQPRDQIFVKSYEFLSFPKAICKDIGTTISTNLSGKHSQKLLDLTKQSTTDAPKFVSKRVIQKTAEATGVLIGNKIANRITKILRSSLHDNSKTNTNEHDKEIPQPACDVVATSHLGLI